MAEKFAPMDISGPKSQLTERWRVWLRNFTFHAEGKANLSNAERKKSELLYRAGTGVQDIFENLTIEPPSESEVETDNEYKKCVRTLNKYFRVEENYAYERYTLRQLKQETGEDVDSFVLRLRKQARHCGYDNNERDSAIRDQLLEKIESQELRRKLFEIPNIQLQKALETARAWETARCHANSIAGIVGERDTVNWVKTRTDKRKPKKVGDNKCFACGKTDHYARDKNCPARGKTCANCGKKNHFASCCKSKSDGFSKDKGQQKKDKGEQKVQLVDEETSDDESFAFTTYFCESDSNVVQAIISDVSTDVLVDSGAQTSVMGEKQYNKLVNKGLKAKLEPDSRNLRVYGNGHLPVIGKISCTVKCFDRAIDEDFLITQGEGRCLLGSSAAKRLGILRIGPQIYSIGSNINEIAEQFPKVFSGLGKLSDYKLSLHINDKFKPVAQKPRRIPYPLKDKVLKKLDVLVDLDIIEKVSGPTTWVSPAVFASKSNGDIRICVDMRRANQAICREKWPIPTVDEILEQMNGSTVFSKLDMNIGSD